MKAKFTLLFLAVALIASNIHAQSPQLINYQSVVRGTNGTPVANGTVVSLKFVIHDQTENGTPVFTETQSDTTNQFGLVNTKIGVTGNLSQVNWGSGPKYLEVDLDPTGGNNFAPMGNAQLLSVPYALYAANSAAGPQGVTGPVGPTGLAGATGVAGATGPSGQDGSAGATGSAGLNGSAGATGAVGATGSDGATGVTGATGLLAAGSAAGNTTYWDGTQWVLNSANLFNNGANIGIGTSTPAYNLQVVGTTSTSALQVTNGATAGYILNSDAVGNASWAAPSAVLVAGNGLAYSGDTLNSFWKDSVNNLSNINSTSVNIDNNHGFGALDVLQNGGKDVILGGGSATGSELKFLYQGVAHYSIYNSGNGNLSIANTSSTSVVNTVGTPIMSFTGAGNVGIGTIAPVNLLSINGSAGIWNTNVLHFYTDSGLTQRGYIGQYGSSNDMSVAATGYSNWLRLGCDSGNIAFFPDGTIASGNVPKVVINHFGQVGIGTLTPTVPLEVDIATTTTPYSSTSVNITHLLSSTNSVLTGTGPLSIVDGQVAISAQGDIVGQGTIAVASSVTYSDERIKNVIGQSDAANDLEVLNRIKITDYTMKDSLWWGYTPFKKVIAQQVEGVYPRAVGRKADFIPNIYAQATKVEKTDNGYLITVDKDLPELNTKKVRLEVTGSGRIEADFDALVGTNQLKVATTADLTKGHVFVFGTQVEDFRTVDYDAISMLNVSATQQLTKELKDAQQRLKQLEAENEKLKTCNTQQQQINKEQSDMMKSMKAQIDLINEQLNLTTHK